MRPMTGCLENMLAVSKGGKAVKHNIPAFLFTSAFSARCFDEAAVLIQTEGNYPDIPQG